METPALTDGVVVLDALRPDDALAMVAADDEATRWAWGRTEPLTADTAQAVIAEAATGWAEGSKLYFAIRSAYAREYIGRFDLWGSGGDHGGRVGIIVAPSHRRGGIAHRAVELGSRYAFDVLDWPFLLAEILPDNIGSLRLAESLGFRRWPGERQTNKGQTIWMFMLSRSDNVYMPPA